jgi:predicted Ser/Thr protein kinase
LKCQLLETKGVSKQRILRGKKVIIEAYMADIHAIDS